MDVARYYFPASTIAAIDRGIRAQEVHSPSGGLKSVPARSPTSKERRAYLIRLVEERCTMDILYPRRIEVVAPMVLMADDVEVAFRAHHEWLESSRTSLAATAPRTVIDGLAFAHINRMRVENPDEYLSWVRGKADAGLPKSPTGMTEDGELAAFGKPEG